MIKQNKKYLENQLAYIYSLKERNDIPKDNLKLIWALQDEARILKLLTSI